MTAAAAAAAAAVVVVIVDLVDKDIGTFISHSHVTALGGQCYSLTRITMNPLSRASH